MKTGQLIQDNMRNIFLEHTQNVVETIFPDPFLKNKKLAYIWINSLKFYSLFLLYAMLMVIENYCN